MKTKISFFVLSAVLLLGAETRGLAQDQSDLSSVHNMVSLGVRRHPTHSHFDLLPYGEGDLSYAIAYEWHEAAGYWQLGLDYTPAVSGSNNTDYVLTPQVNLIIKDNMWLGGVGVLFSNIFDDDGGNDWTDAYWQLMAGVSLPLRRIQANAFAIYVFEKWDRLDDFAGRDLDYALWLSFSF